MNILVTGAYGFIGLHVCNYLRKNYNHNLFYYNRNVLDLTKIEQVKRIMRVVNPDIVYHLAANPNVKEDIENPTKISHDNIISTHNLLCNCKQNTRFVFSSSVTVYGESLKNSICNEESKTLPNSIYGATKLASETLVEAYTRLGKIQGVSLRLTANVGPCSTHGVVRDLIKKIVESRSNKLEVIGEKPGSVKPFTYVEDTAKFIVECGFNSLTGPINIGNSDSISVENIAKCILNFFHKKKKIVWTQPTWPGDNNLVFISNTKAKKCFWEPVYDSSLSAIKKTCAFYDGEF